MNNKYLYKNLNIKEINLLLFLFIFSITTNLNAQIKTVNAIVTAPKGYSARLAKALNEHNINAIKIPFIETIIEQQPDVDELLKNISDYDYIAFSSRKAIESFSINLEKYPKARKKLNKVKLCAIGKDNEYLTEKLGIKPAIIPDEPSPIGIALKLGEQKNIKGKKIAVLVPKVEEIEEPNVVPDFISKLESVGLIVKRIDAYITKPTDNSEIEKAIELISAKEVDYIAFTSSGEIESLLINLKNKDILENVVIACFGPYTASFAKNKGLKVDIIAKDFSSFSGFAEAIELFHKK